MKKRPLPLARVGDVVVGDLHPQKGFVMFRVSRAYKDSDQNYCWIYVSEDGETKMNEMFVEHIYRQKGLK